MKKILQLSLIIYLLVLYVPLQAQSNDHPKGDNQVEKKVMVYYFHFTRRCATCNAVEEVSKATVIEEYGEKVDFESCNLDKDTGKSIGDELGISGQTLVIVSGEKQIDLTSEAFLFARSNPDKLSKLLQKEIDALL